MVEGRQGWTCLLMLICVCVTVGTVIPIGYAMSVINKPSAFIRSWMRDVALTRYSARLSDLELAVLMTCVVSIFLVGGMLGSPFGPVVTASLGRRGTLLLGGILLLVSSLFQLFCRLANSIVMLLLGRLITGVAAGLIYATQPMYLVELAPSELRGSVGVFTCIGVTGGIVIGQIFSFDITLGTEKLWHYALAASGMFVVIGLGPIAWFPESPRYLVSKGKTDKAKAALMRLRGDEERVNAELAEIVASVAETGQKLSFKEVFCNSKLKMPLILVSSFHFVQMMSGISAIWSYSVDIFTQSGFNLMMAMWLTFAEGVLNFAIALLAPVLMRRFDRRIMMMLSCLMSAICLTLLCGGLKLMIYHKEASYACIAFLSLYIVAFNLGLGPIPYFIGSEIFESPARPTAMAFGSFSNWLANFLLNMLFPLLNSAIGPFAFLMCALVCVYGFLLTCRYLPETRNRDTKEVTPLMENGFKSKIK